MKIEEAFQRLSVEVREAIILSTIESYRHVLEMSELGCTGPELTEYLKALIRLECQKLPAGVVK